MGMSRYVLGLDPGSRGAIALLSRSFTPDRITKNSLILYPFAADKDKLPDVLAAQRFLAGLKDCHIDICFIELVHSLGLSAARATFNFGFNTGVAYALLRLLEWSEQRPINVMRVPPPIWQKNVWQPQHIVYNASGKRDAKATSLRAVQEIFPGVSFIMPRGHVPHDGCVDAALIAYYGLMSVNHSLPHPPAPPRPRRKRSK